MTMPLKKSTSHGKIGEAAVYAKCWMHGFRAYSTGGLRNNFAGSDLIVETADMRKKLWIQVKTGAPVHKNYIYLTQCTGNEDHDDDKFSSDFVVFVNIQPKAAKVHAHDGQLDFKDLSYFVVPTEEANCMFKRAVRASAAKPKRDGGQRKLSNVAIDVPEEDMRKYQDAWHLLRSSAADRG